MASSVFLSIAKAALLRGAPITEGMLRVLANDVGREIPLGIVQLWTRVNGCSLNYHRIYGLCPRRHGLTDTRDVLASFSQWKDLGWIPLAGDLFGNHFVSIPTEHGDVVGFIDLGFDDPDRVLCVAGSSIVQFCANILALDAGENNYNKDPALMAIDDPGRLRAETAISHWIKYR